MKITADYLKTRLMEWFFYDGYYIGSYQEVGFMDIVAIKRSLFAVEYEIKTSRKDLRNELKTVKEATKVLDHKFKSFDEMQTWLWRRPREELIADRKLSDSKLYKHRRYLYAKRINGQDRMFIPNEFNFLVPEKLKDFALEYIDGTPYGLHVFVEIEDGGVYLKIVKKPKRLHSGKIKMESVLYMAKKASNDCYLMRREKENGVK